MGRYESSGLSVDDAQAYSELAVQLDLAMPGLIADGRVPDSEAMHEFLLLFQRVISEIRAQAAIATSDGSDVFDVGFDMTAQELRTYSDMAGSLGSLLEIMAIRGTIDLSVPEKAVRFAEALGAGTFVA